MDEGGTVQPQVADVPRIYPVLAGIASFTLPGLGQAICGRYRRAVACFAGIVFLYTIWTPGLLPKHQGLKVLLPWAALICWAAWDAYRCGMEKARKEAALEPLAPNPLPEGQPVSMPVRVAAGTVACWLLPNALLLTIVTGPMIFAIIFPIITGMLAYKSWSCGFDALSLAKGQRFRFVRNGWTGKSRPFGPIGLGEGIWLSAIGVACWLIMAGMAVPKFAQLIRYGNEGAMKGNLGSIRSALSIYYGDMQGQYPADLAALTAAGKYLLIIPNAKISTYHSDTSMVREGRTPDDTGGWLYDNVVGDANYGTLWVNCTHTDTKGTVWTSY